MFNLDQRLQNDTVHIVDLPLCRVLLMNDSQFPWLILVPRINDLVELTDLTDEQMACYVEESRQVSAILTVLYHPDKLNIAALGNVVRQLHIHHVARYERDVAWPAPIWGRQPVKPYSDEQLQHEVNQLKQAFSAEEKP